MPTQDWTSGGAFAEAQRIAFEQFVKGVTYRAAFEPEAQTALASRLGQLQGELLRRHAAVWHALLQGRPPDDVEPDGGRLADARLGGPEWSASPYFDYLRRAYAINADFLERLVDSLELEPEVKHRAAFAVRQLIEAMNPANFAATNPQVLKLAVETQGASLARGLVNLLEDVRKGRISTTDESAFEVGRNVAVTPGHVIFENDLIQLIQYTPLVARVHARPLVMVPPCINKYYILDLQQENSFVRHALEHGHQVFMVSWRNVNRDCAHFDWDDYLESGVLKALEVAMDVCRSPEVNVLGFCVGGTMAGAALAVLAARGDRRVSSLTLLASMLDFHDTGDIAVFIDETWAAAREAAIGKGGVMPGRELALAFSALRPADLVWSYVENNYLKGRSPRAFDLLFWNADGTNLPGPMFCYYVRRMYIENALKDAGRLTMLGTPVDMGRVDVPVYVLATREDHIVPWRTAYRSTGLLGGSDKRFVLGASGHVAGVVNPPSRNRRSYWTGETLPTEADDWLDRAEEHHGSWWTDWTTWLARHGGRKVKARKTPGNARYRPIEPAPGRYVKERADGQV